MNNEENNDPVEAELEEVVVEKPVSKTAYPIYPSTTTTVMFCSDLISRDLKTRACNYSTSIVLNRYVMYYDYHMSRNAFYRFRLHLNKFLQHTQMKTNKIQMFLKIRLKKVILTRKFFKKLKTQLYLNLNQVFTVID